MGCQGGEGALHIVTQTAERHVGLAQARLKESQSDVSMLEEG